MQAAELVYLAFEAGVVLIVNAVLRMHLVQRLQRLAGKLGIFPELPVQLARQRLNIYPALSQGCQYVLEMSQNNRPVTDLYR